MDNIKDNDLIESKKESEDKDSRDNIINENDKNYIMNKIPVPKNRFGGVQKNYIIYYSIIIKIILKIVYQIII